jgi:hypothetical protein
VFVDVERPLWREVGVYSFQLLLRLASAVFVGSESRGTHDNILLSQFLRLCQHGRPGSCIHSLRNRVAQLYPRHWGYNCCLIVSCSADFRPWRWRWYISPKRRFTYGISAAMSQKLTTLKKTIDAHFGPFKLKCNVYLFLSNICRRKWYLNPCTQRKRPSFFAINTVRRRNWQLMR